MLRSTKELEGYAIRATDGVVGHVKGFYFDDETWVVRYLIVDTGGWLSNRNVLISPIAIKDQRQTDKTLSVSITKEQVQNSPDIDTDKPVSRQHESEYLGYYGYAYYWGGIGLWGANGYPSMMSPGYTGFYSKPHALPPEVQKAHAQVETARRQNDDQHLRSCNEVTGYRIHATDGEIGHVSGFIVDDETWAVRYLIVNTSNWWLGHQIVVSPQWIRDVNWSDSSVSVGLTRQAVRDAPIYTSAAELNRQQETNIYEHYGRAAYWAADERKHKETESA